jgi:hypothetical protein
VGFNHRRPVAWPADGARWSSHRASRGAYTRALCGMLYRVGLMRPGSENLIPYALRVYARRPGADSNLALPGGFDLMDEFASGLSRTNAEGGLSFPITFLGLFDTVKGTGIIGRDITWAYIICSPMSGESFMRCRSTRIGNRFASVWLSNRQAPPTVEWMKCGSIRARHAHRLTKSRG